MGDGVGHGVLVESQLPYSEFQQFEGTIGSEQQSQPVYNRLNKALQRDTMLLPSFKRMDLYAHALDTFHDSFQISAPVLANNLNDIKYPYTYSFMLTPMLASYFSWTINPQR